jgi:Glutathione S-transferase
LARSLPIEADGLTLFESGAIVLYIADRSEALAPSDAHGLARTKSWIFAALNSVEPAVMTLVGLDLFHAGETWAAESRPVAVQAVQKRLAALEQWLGGRDYLEDRFTAGDLLMTTVLRILRHTDIVSGRPTLGRIRSAARRGLPFRGRWQTTSSHTRRLQPEPARGAGSEQHQRGDQRP